MKNNIAFLGPAPPFRGGISSFATQLAREMVKCGYDVKMFSFFKQYPQVIFPGKEQLDPDMDTYNLDIEACFTPYLPHTWKNAVNKLKEYEPDVLVVSFWIPLMAPALGWICSMLKPSVKVIYLIHNIDFHEKWPLAKLFTKYAMRSASHYMTLSEKTVSDLKQLIPHNRYSAIIKGFHPIYENYSAESLIHRKSVEHTILFFGLIKAYKGLDVLLKAFPLVLEHIQDARLVIAGEIYGDDTVYDELVKQIQPRTAVEASFKYVPDSEVTGYFHNSNVCVIPYKSATQSGVISIAFAHNLPVIASDVGGISEAIEDGVNGLLVPADDVEALSNAIIRYFKENMQAKMAENIRSSKSTLTWEALVRNMESVL
ncbi:MAG: glycosyl transferase family 1 [Candidatus Cloacimonetes bacterium HGW-Cloacimonetes-1]|jgi:glycosyltransferase involved in cell wall biosynthesis|nr:MAG: glycosyl transferase family 1 [Candidatus Cloacimonetes bacterium HGW-Cloacimonetes-1]